MNHPHDFGYLELLQLILDQGEDRDDRTGTGTRGIFGHQIRFNLQYGFPLLTTKKLHWPSIIWELLWFLRGETNIQWLQARGVTIWDEWAKEDGSLGPIYGAQWRSWPTYRKLEAHTIGYEWRDETYIEDSIDQLANVINTLQRNPNDRRMVVSAWNVGQISEMALPPCHLLFQFYVRQKRYLDCQMYQRSCDVFLGMPFNIASYAALVHIIAHLTRLEPGEFIWTGGDVHIYHNHLDKVRLQLTRHPRPSPTLTLRPDAPTDLDGDWHLDHFVLEGYDPYPAIRARVAI